MRLQDSQVALIGSTVPRLLGTDCNVYLFGSRVKDDCRGGDVDLLVETPGHVPYINHVRLKAELESAMGLPIDLIIRRRDKKETAFQKIAKANSVPILEALADE